MRIKYLIIILLGIIVIKFVVLPLVVGIYYYYPFQRHVVACDTAMEDSWFYKDKLINKSEQVQMLDCHEYDKARKIMLMSGIPEEYLSYLGLKALELYERPAEEFAMPHRFRER